MFRDDGIAQAEQNEQLRREVGQLRAENAAMRDALQAYRIDVSHAYAQRSIYDSNGFGLSEGDRVALSKHRLEAFPVWAAVLLHVVTFGVFSIVHFGRMQAQLPRLRPDDPTFARSIGMFFVPYVNIWWAFFAPLRLVDRINFQFLLRDREAPLTKTPIVVGAILSFFLYFFPIGWFYAVMKTQRAVNELVALGPVETVANVNASAQFSTGVRVDAHQQGFEPMPAQGYETVEAYAAQGADTRNATR